VRLKWPRASEVTAAGVAEEDPHARSLSAEMLPEAIGVPCMLFRSVPLIR
jgi:hypothetical protein